MLIGDQINFSSLGNNLDLILVAIAAILVTRAVVIYGLSAISNAFSTSPIELREQTVLWWGGLRGSVSIAVALSVPVVLNGREEIIDIVFGVVLFTLLVQGLTTQWLLKKLNLIGDSSLRQDYVELLARKVALGRVVKFLATNDLAAEIDPEYYRYQQELVKGELSTIQLKITAMQQEHDNLRSLTREQLQEQLLDIEADTYAEFIRAGKLTENLSPVLQEILAKAGDS